jgi:O-antigen ligase
MAACMLLVGGALVLFRDVKVKRAAYTVDFAVLLLLAITLIPIAQSAAGLFVYSGEAVLQAIYLIGFAITFFVARNASGSSLCSLLDFLWAGLAGAALASAMLAVYQWMGGDFLGWLVSPVKILGRAEANVGQTNNLATLLCWGLVALWWGAQTEKINGYLAMAGAALLLLGLALTESRTGLLILALFPMVLFVGRSHFNARLWRVMGALFIWFFLCELMQAQLTEWTNAAPARALNSQLSVGTRPLIWQLALDAIAERPWFGYGWNQFLVARVDLASSHPQHPVMSSYAHNFILDIFVWAGVVVGVVLTVSVLVWLWRRVHAAADSREWLLILGLGVVLIHASLELPHAYTYFLLPAAVMAGSLSALQPSRVLIGVPSVLVGLAILGLGIVWSVLVYDYQEIEKRAQTARILDAGIHAKQGSQHQRQLLLLQFVADIDDQLRRQPGREMSLEELRRWRDTLRRYPVASSLARYAQASILNGYTAEALWGLQTLCNLYPKALCDAAGREWVEFQTAHALYPLSQPPASPKSF